MCTYNPCYTHKLTFKFENLGGKALNPVPEKRPVLFPHLPDAGPLPHGPFPPNARLSVRKHGASQLGATPPAFAYGIMAPPLHRACTCQLTTASPSRRWGATLPAATHQSPVRGTARSGQGTRPLRGRRRTASPPRTAHRSPPPPRRRPASFPAPAAAGRSPTPRQVRAAATEAGSKRWKSLAVPGPLLPLSLAQVMSGGGEEEAGTAGGFSAALVPPLEAVHQAQPASAAGSRRGHSLAGPNSCLQRHLDAGSEWRWGPEEVIPASVDGAPLFCWKALSAAEFLVSRLGPAWSSDRRVHGKCEDPPTLGSLFKRSRSWWLLNEWARCK